MPFKKIKKKLKKAVSSVKKTVSKVTPKVKVNSKGTLRSVGNILKSAGKLSENSLKSTGKLAIGDFKGAAQSGLKASSSASDIAGEAGGQAGSIFGQRKAGDMAGRVGAEVGANVATGGTYGAVKSAASAMAGDGLEGLLKSNALKDLAISAAGSYAGVDPNMIKAGLSATQGDLKGAALQGLSSMGAVDPNQLQMGLSALSGDKKQLASSLSSQFGIDPKTAEMIGGLAGSKDLKGAALQQLGSMAGFDPKQLQAASSLISGDKSGLASNLASQFGAGGTASSMIGQFAGGKGVREVASDQAGAYATDEANLALDAKQKDLISKFKKGTGGIQDLSGKLGKGVVESGQLTSKQLNDLRSVSDLSGKLGKGVVESGEIGQQQFNIGRGQTFDPNQAFQEWSKSQTGYIGKEKKQFMQDLFNKRASGQISNDDFNKQMVSQGEQGFLEKIKGGIGTTLSSAKDFAAGNKDVLNLAAQGISSYAGYQAGKEGFEQAKKLQQEQMAELARAGQQFESIKFDPERYATEESFLANRIAGGGLTDVERQLQQQGDIRAARAAAAQRMSGIETQARLGGAGLGTAALAGALAGGQSEQNIQSQTNLAREASSSERLQGDIQRLSTLATQQTQEEADLAKAQGIIALQRAQQAALARASMGNLAQDKAASTQNLYGNIANLASTGLGLMKTPEQLKQEADQKSYDEQMKNLELKKKEAEVQNLKGGASNVVQNKGSIPSAGTKTPQVTQTTQQVQKPATTTPIGTFNQTYTGPMARPVNTAVNTAQKAKEEADKFKKDPWGTVSSWGKK